MTDDEKMAKPDPAPANPECAEKRHLPCIISLPIVEMRSDENNECTRSRKRWPLATPP